MARTAPVPNLPPIPGMCPGMIVAGGGGGGGSGSGKGGKKGKGKKEGKGKKKKKDPKGAGKGGKCGKGGAAGCSGCSKKPAAGDPVDVGSGQVFTNAVDMELPGPFDLEWKRSYSSGVVNEDRGLGFGWSFTFAWSFTISGRFATIVDGGGQAVLFDLPLEVGGISDGGGWILERTHEGFVLDCGTDFRHVFRPIASDPNRYRLAEIVAQAKNRIVLHHDDRGRLTQVVDSAGRVIHVETTYEGRVRRITVPDGSGVQAITFATYGYDEAGNLVSVTDADGNKTQYAYHEGHLLAAIRHPSGLTFHYVYDKQARCLESWGDYPGGQQDPALATDLSPFLADGVTRAKGLFHVKIAYAEDGGREVVSTSEIQTYFVDEEENVTKAVGNGGVTTRVFDDDGNVIAQTDRNGATFTYSWDQRGRLIKETDPLGRTIQFVRDELGRVVEMIDPAGGSVRATRDVNGFIETITDQVGAVTMYILDERGLMREQVHANGGRSRYVVDAHANLIETHLPNGAVWKWSFDWWGRMVERTDPKGNVTEFAYSPAGRLSSFRERDGGTTVIHRDEMTNPIEIVNPDGSIERKHWGGVHWLHEEIAANGDTKRGCYDREGRLLAVVNELGETHRLEWGLTGGPVREFTFDGREERRGFDPMGNLLWEDVGYGKSIRTYDPAAQIVQIAYGDGTSETYGYDIRGELIEAKGPMAEIKFERDPTGKIIRETVMAAGETTVVSSQFTRDGERAALETSFGHRARFERDAVGFSAAIVIDDAERVGFVRDPFGKIITQQLPRGGAIESEYDPLTRLARRRVISPTLGMKATPNEPIWVAGRPGNASVEKGYRYSPRGQVVEATTLANGSTQYEYDLRDRVLARIPANGEAESFAYDPACNVFERGLSGTKREYAAGNRLLARGPARYEYDEAGFLSQKLITYDDGREDTWRYEWNGQGSLSAVHRPDGVRVEFEYDPLGRRTSKRVFEPNPLDVDYRLRKRSRYVWDERKLLHERTIHLDESGRESSREERTFLFDETTSYSPIAERAVVADAAGRRGGEWLFYATDVMGTPEELVRGDGTVAGVLERSTWGRTRFRGEASTNVRFPGQYEDEETGLAYNLFRYYDPEIGRFISPDPIALEGGINVYAYCQNPINEFDPWGLAGGHGMDFSVVDKNNKPVGPQTAGAKDPDDPSKWAKLESGNNGKPNKDPKWGSQADGHTERKALHLLDTNKNARDALKDGGTAKMKGEFPPCKRCHKKMEKWAKKNLKGTDGKIEYKYPVKQTMTYTGDGAKAKDGTKAADLKAAYDQKGNTPGKKGKWLTDDNGAQIKGPNGKPIENPKTAASQEYQKQKAAAQAAGG